MTAVEPTQSAAPPVAEPVVLTAAPPNWWDRVEVLLERAGEYLNPILMKEARQALKSRQFVITFTLVLILGWGWSLLGLAMMGQEVYYTPSGPWMLIGYLWVLGFPLVLIVPFTAFRSLSSERKDGTYELLSITTLLPRQIVGGKLASAVLQMLVYLSALTPCIAFTYLLRGIDMITILLFVSYTCVLSLLLSIGGLLLATTSRARAWQIVLSVVMVLALAAVYALGVYCVSGFLSFGEVMPIDQVQFWVANGFFFSMAASFFVLLYLAAAARISFASDNRSTKLRIVMLVQQAMFTGWFMSFALTVPREGKEIMMVYLACSAVYWMATGAIMCGENPRLSDRVKRTLPQSLLARTLGTWFNPGPGTGYMFAICNLLAVLLVSLLVGLELKLHNNPSVSGSPAPGLIGVAFRMLVYSGRLVASQESLDRLYDHLTGLYNSLDLGDDWVLFGGFLFCYVCCYLGIGRVLILAVRQVARVGLFVSFLFQLVLLLMGSLVPLIVQLSLPEGWDGYTSLQVTNPVWTLIETGKGTVLTHSAHIPLFNWDVPAVPLVLVPAACLLFLLNLALTAREAALERIAAPQRVLEDERELHPERYGRPTRLSPWDEDPKGS